MFMLWCEVILQIQLSYPMVDKIPDQNSWSKGPCRVHSGTSVVHLGKRKKDKSGLGL